MFDFQLDKLPFGYYNIGNLSVSVLSDITTEGSKFTESLNMNSSVNIIGGSDGPTKIFLSGDIKNTVIAGVVITVAIIAVITAIYFIKRKNK